MFVLVLVMLLLLVVLVFVMLLVVLVVLVVLVLALLLVMVVVVMVVVVGGGGGGVVPTSRHPPSLVHGHKTSTKQYWTGLIKQMRKIKAKTNRSKENVHRNKKDCHGVYDEWVGWVG